MQLTVLGCRSGMPADGQASSGYLVQDGTTAVLLDCGPGIATALSALSTPDVLTAVVISHMHSDHCYDLLPLGKMLLGTGARGVPLYVPEGGRATLDQLAALFPVTTYPILDKAFELAFDVREYRPGQHIELPGATIDLFPTRHAAPNCGSRLRTPSGTLAFTGDTGLTDALDPLAHGVDMLLAEASLESTDLGPHGHLSGGDAGLVAARNGVRELVLTHFPSADPDLLEARQKAAAQEYDGPIRIAQPGRVFDVST